jgi:hypothetical protein
MTGTGSARPRRRTAPPARTAGCLLAMLALVVACSRPAPPPAESPSARVTTASPGGAGDCLRAPDEDCPVLWGVYLPQVPGDPDWAAPFTELEAQVDRRFDLVKRYHDWSNQGGNGQFPDPYERELGADGTRTLYIAWTSNVYATGGTTPWAEIAAGDHDESVILPAAERVRQWGRTVVIDFDHEMDGHTRTGNGTPEEYVAAYRHVVETFDAAGADNVVWAWVPTGTMANAERIAQMYPGDEHVDWVGYDPYNFYSCNGTAWETPLESMRPFHDWLLEHVTSTKPILLGEYGSVVDESDPARVREWYAQVPDALAALPRIRAVVQWSSTTAPECDFRLTGQALEGFAAAGRHPYVTGD